MFIGDLSSTSALQIPAIPPPPTTPIIPKIKSRNLDIRYGMVRVALFYAVLVVQTLRTNELKVWTVLSTDDIVYNKCSLSYLVQ